LNRRTAEYDVFGTSLQRTLTTVYGAAGNVVQNIDALNKTTTTVFDGLNRAISVTDPMCLLINGWSSLGIPKAATLRIS
jgi:YD repeat-containing protein